MRALILKNTAGALTPIVEWLDAQGHECVVIVGSKKDASHHRKLMRSKFVVVENPMRYYLTVVYYIRHFRPHIIHSNSLVGNLVLSRIFAPKTPLVHMYHGSDVRKRKSAHIETQLADKVFVTTPDLCRYGEWFDRVVMDNFYYKGGRVESTALMLYSPNVLKDLRQEAKDWCEKRGIRLKIIDRSEQHIDHNKMPDILSSFEYYLDFRGYGVKGALSLTALEALRCGCKVVSDADTTTVIIQNDYRFIKPMDYLVMYKSLRGPTLRQLLFMMGPLLLGVMNLIFGRR